MFVKRLFPSRWAKILAWTGAALAWGSVAVAGAQEESASQEPIQDAVQPLERSTTTLTSIALPSLPADGLVVIRYTPVDPPAPEVIVNTATRTKPGQTAVASRPKVKSSGS